MHAVHGLRCLILWIGETLGSMERLLLFRLPPKQGGEISGTQRRLTNNLIKNVISNGVRNLRLKRSLPAVEMTTYF